MTDKQKETALAIINSKGVCAGVDCSNCPAFCANSSKAACAAYPSDSTLNKRWMEAACKEVQNV